MQNIPQQTIPHINNVSPAIFQKNCAHCGKQLEDNRVVICIGQPYHVILHKHCSCYFDYTKGYPWPEPFVCYDKFSNHHQ